MEGAVYIEFFITQVGDTVVAQLLGFACGLSDEVIHTEADVTRACMIDFCEFGIETKGSIVVDDAGIIERPVVYTEVEVSAFAGCAVCGCFFCFFGDVIVGCPVFIDLDIEFDIIEGDPGDAQLAEDAQDIDFYAELAHMHKGIACKGGFVGHAKV